VARHCTCCIHPERDSIDSAIVCGDSVRTIGKRFGVSPDAVSRHSRNHLSDAIVGMKTQAQAEGRASLVDRIEVLITNAETMFATAAEAGHGAQALAVLKELRSQLELLGKADGSLATTPTVTINLMASEEYIAVRSAIFAALMQYPEARAEVAGRLLALEAGPS
jgi:hypothetical protein